MQAAVAIGLQDLRPLLPAGVPAPLEKLVRGCWARRPSSRPKFEDIILALNEAHTCLAPPEHAWLDNPTGHPVYGNPEAGQEPAGQGAPPPPGGQRPAARAPEVMAAIIEPAAALGAPQNAERQKFVVGGT